MPEALAQAGINSAAPQRDRTFYAPFEGRVSVLGWQFPENPNAGLGYRMHIRGNDGKTILLGHLDPSAVTVRQGETVTFGQRLGVYADPSNGTTTGPHLHVELRGPLWELLDPTPHLQTVVPNHAPSSKPSPARKNPATGEIRPHNGFDIVGPLRPD